MKLYIQSIVAFCKKKWFLTGSLMTFLLIVLFLKFFVGYSPFLIQFDQKSYWMIWTDEPKDGTALKAELLKVQYDYTKIKSDLILWPLLSKGSNRYNSNAEWKKPFSSSDGGFHFFGTFELGQDLFFSCLLGMQKSLSIALLSIMIALSLGLPLGVSAPFLQIRKFRLSLSFLILAFSILFILFYFILITVELKSISNLGGIFFLVVMSMIILLLYNKENKGITVPLDSIFINGLLIVKSIPMMLILLLLLQWIEKPGIMSLSLIIGIYLSLGIAKYARYLTMSMSQENYIQSLISLGYKDRRIILFHLIPSVFKNLVPLISLYIASVILVEASISFLGLGLPIEELSLGSIMHTARSNTAAWWVVLFPGLCVFWMVHCFQRLNSMNWEKDSL
ncbi:MAG: ABC transporter permease subunit [Saprospiraceae bacterium]|nr:ABC transporter permease subunit [Saprospiraceae bacterium]